jgi:rod shape determining protein RodA
MNNFIKELRLLKKMNWPMVIAVAVLTVIGVIFIYSSCFVSEDQPVRSLFRKQIVWAVAGSLCYLVFAVLDYHELRKIAWWTYIAGIVLLIIVLLVGTRIYGARRWLLLFGIGIQPSELAKLAMILVLARRLSRPAIFFEHFKPVGVLLIVTAIPVMLIAKEPDIGTSLIFLTALFVMLFVAGVPMRIVGGLVLAGVVVSATVLSALFLPEKLGLSEEKQAKIMHLVGVSEYHKDRMKVFLKSDVDPLGAGWNKMQSEMAVGSGGLWGKGFLKGTQNILGFLPPSVAPTDFIYSVIAEESGFFGSVIVIFFFGVLVSAGVMTALRARDKFGRLLCVGIVAMIFSHAAINIAMTVGLMPIIGVPLPLISYGGSFMIVTMSALGIIQSVYVRSRSFGEEA